MHNCHFNSNSRITNNNLFYFIKKRCIYYSGYKESISFYYDVGYSFYDSITELFQNNNNIIHLIFFNSIQPNKNIILKLSKSSAV